MRRGLRSAVAPSGLSSTSVRFAHPSGKKASTAHFAGGARNVARIKVASYLLRLCALLCSPFSAVKMGGPFSLRCLSPLGSPAGGAGQTQPMRIGMFWRGLGGFAAQNSRLGFCSTVGINNHAQTTQLDALMQLGYFRNTKGQRDFISTLAFLASHEARRRMAVFSIQLARSHTRPASRGTCRATAVKSRPSLMSFEYSRALWARCGVQGHCPCAPAARSPRCGAQPRRR